MINAKEELLEMLVDLGETTKIKCALIEHEETEFILKLHHSEEEYNNFLDLLDFEYEDDFGHQNLYGTVWLEDGTWLSRGEYGGSEWWIHNVLPEIPLKCIKLVSGCIIK